MSKASKEKTIKPMTRKKFLFNQISLLIVVALFLIDKSMFYSWVRNFFNMLNISNIEPVFMALWMPVRVTHGIFHLLSPLYLLQFVIIISFVKFAFMPLVDITFVRTDENLDEKLTSRWVNDAVENSQFTYLQTQRFLC